LYLRFLHVLTETCVPQAPRLSCIPSSSNLFVSAKQVLEAQADFFSFSTTIKFSKILENLLDFFQVTSVHIFLFFSCSKWLLRFFLANYIWAQTRGILIVMKSTQKMTKCKKCSVGSDSKFLGNIFCWFFWLSWKWWKFLFVRFRVWLNDGMLWLWVRPSYNAISKCYACYFWI